jgi:hypothetical protein
MRNFFHFFVFTKLFTLGKKYLPGEKGGGYQLLEEDRFSAARKKETENRPLSPFGSEKRSPNCREAFEALMDYFAGCMEATIILNVSA